MADSAQFGIRGWWGTQNGYYLEGNGRTNGIDTPALFERNINITAAMSSLRLDYDSVHRRLTFFWDGDAATGDYGWVGYGGTFLSSGTYDLKLAPSDTLTVLLVGSSKFQTVASGQAYFDNLEITIKPPYTWTTNDGKITIISYTGGGGVLDVPAIITGLPVTRIGDSAFNGRTNVTSVTIPDTVVSIGDLAFYQCYGLTNVLLGKNIETIHTWAFSWCTNLPAITIPDSVRTLGSSAFNYCTGLTSAQLPKGITSLEGFTFYGCSSLTNITIPDTVTSIGNSAFAMCSALTRAIIGKNVTLLGDRVFYICPNLAGVYFAGNAPGAGAEAIYGAPSSTVYYLPGTAGWTATFAGRPTALWVLPYPVILTFEPNFGIQSNKFGFAVSWASNAYVVVEAAASLASPSWSPVRTNGLVNGTYYFADPRWTDHPNRFYRIRRH